MPQELLREVDAGLPQIGLAREARQTLHEGERLIGIELHGGAKQV